MACLLDLQLLRKLPFDHVLQNIRFLIQLEYLLLNLSPSSGLRVLLMSTLIKK